MSIHCKASGLLQSQRAGGVKISDLTQGTADAHNHYLFWKMKGKHHQGQCGISQGTFVPTVDDAVVQKHQQAVAERDSHQRDKGLQDSQAWQNTSPLPGADVSLVAFLG